MLINDVRNTVLAIANKNNYGYISPQDFNLYAKQAQLDIFEDYFYQYNNWITRENKRTSGSGYADIIKGLEEVIDSFSQQVFLTQNNANTYNLPSDYYLINKVFYYPSLLFSGTSTQTSLNQLIDGSNPFNDQPPSSPNPPIGSIVINTTDFTQAYVTSVPSTSTLGLSSDIFTIGENYRIYSNTNITEVERVTQRKIFNLTSSNLTYPTKQFPCYVLDGNIVTVYPSTILNAGDVHSQYIRYPKDPKWTFLTLTGGEPLFDSSQSDFQDFELPLSDQPQLIMKICQYVGIEIREAEVVKFAQEEEIIDTQETS